MNLKLPRYRSLPAEIWPEVLAAITGLYWILFGPFPPNVSMLMRIIGTFMAVCMICSFNERHWPSDDATPRLRFRFYLRLAAWYLVFVAAMKSMAWLISLSLR
ncbi:MAG: hypothetical protein ACO1QS_04930 [Verrucomicrobiota bacterium]